tara:strand:+ start:364 stop:609 length:246 start_codon:yes stop_codon:yes gene_type:complete
MKIGDLVHKRRDYKRDHAFQRMPVGIVVKKNGLDPSKQQGHIMFKVRWFKTDHFWRPWWLESELVLITKPLEVWQKSDVVP